MLKFVNKVTVKFHPFHPKNGTARQMLSFLNAPKTKAQFPKVELDTIVEYDEYVEPSVTIDYSTNESKVYHTAAIKFQDLQSQIYDTLALMERDAGMSAPQLAEDDNPYVELAEQYKEKLEEKKARAQAAAKRQ